MVATAKNAQVAASCSEYKGSIKFRFLHIVYAEIHGTRCFIVVLAGDQNKVDDLVQFFTLTWYIIL
jgi:hypothetical protein